MSESSGGLFKVCWSENNRATVLQIGKNAIRLGLKADFIRALKKIVDKLTREPLSWGDPYYPLPSAGLLVFHGISPPLHVYYGVDPVRRLVYIKEIEALPGILQGDA
jgi:hypothetical protein